MISSLKHIIGIVNKQFHTPFWLFALLLLVLIFRIPTFFEPYSYGDETIYLTLGQGIKNGVPLYKGLHDNKPPLLYLTAALAGNLFWFKAILAISQIIGIYLFWKLTRLLLPRPKNKSARKVATIIFVLLTTLPFLEGNIANAELFMIIPTIAAFLLLLGKDVSFRKIFLAGMFFSFASLYKIPAAFELPVIIVYWILTSKLTRVDILNIIKKTCVLFLGFSLPLAFTFIWYFLQGAFKEYLIAAFLQNFGYLSSWRPAVTKEPFIVKNAPLLIRAGVLVFINLLLVIKRKSLSKEFMLSVIWISCTLFAVTLSERPYPHYLIQSIPSLSILLAILFAGVTFDQVLVIIPLTLFSIIPVYYKYWHYRSSAYYSRSINFAIGKTSKDDYIASFGSEVIRNYKISEFIRTTTKPEDKVFVWEDSAQIYALSKRLPPVKYVAGYHIKDFYSTTDLVLDLKRNMPKQIIILSKPPDDLTRFIKANYFVIDNIDGAEIWSLTKQEIRAMFAR